MQTKVERGNRVFPITDKSQDVLQALLNRLKRLGVKIQTNTKVEEILLREGKVIGVTFSHNGESIPVILTACTSASFFLTISR